MIFSLSVCSAVISMMFTAGALGTRSIYFSNWLLPSCVQSLFVSFAPAHFLLSIVVHVSKDRKDAHFLSCLHILCQVTLKLLLEHIHVDSALHRKIVRSALIFHVSTLSLQGMLGSCSTYFCLLLRGWNAAIGSCWAASAEALIWLAGGYTSHRGSHRR